MVSLVVMMSFSMVTPSLTLYAQQDLEADELLVGAAIAGFAVGQLVFDTPAVVLADRLGRNRTMILGLGILVGSSVLAGIASSYCALLSARVLERIGSLIYVSAAIMIVLLLPEVSRRGTNIRSYLSMLMLGHIVGPIVGAPIAPIFRHNALYFAFAAMIALSLRSLACLLTFAGSVQRGLLLAHESRRRQQT